MSTHSEESFAGSEAPSDRVRRLRTEKQSLPVVDASDEAPGVTAGEAPSALNGAIVTSILAAKKSALIVNKNNRNNYLGYAFLSASEQASAGVSWR